MPVTSGLSAGRLLNGDDGWLRLDDLSFWQPGWNPDEGQE